MRKNTNRVKVEYCPPGIAIGAIPTQFDKHSPGWKLECIGVGRQKKSSSKRKRA